MVYRLLKLTAALAMLLALPLHAADLPPDTTTEIPASALRPTVVTLAKDAPLPTVPKADLPANLELAVAAAAPLVTHPIMGCIDDRGRLYVGDATGVNWNKAQLEANPPNRVLMLEDVDHDGRYDKSTIFADKMTFPQGACWLDGSLYVCSPPGLWKLTDTNGDGVADQREMIVSGFDYTGNAADVHGPFLGPDGRLYWCHGRKGHKVIGKEGVVVHEALASGIWSCKPDGSDVQWHSLACGDNPVEVDFTPDGDVIGVQNLYYSQPRGDTIVHWLYGGVYERADQMKAIAGQPRTLDRMPVVYNFGHVAVSGCAFYRSGVLFPATSLQLLVTHFNTQRVVRVDLTPEGATFAARENEFLKVYDPDIHFTDVLEDRDGSLLVLDTGGWFRIGCPSSLMAKPDMKGAVYRVREKRVRDRSGPIATLWSNQEKSKRNLREQLTGTDPCEQLRALESIAKTGAKSPEIAGLLLAMLSRPLEPTLEHALLWAVMRCTDPGLLAAAPPRNDNHDWTRRRLKLLQQMQPASLSAQAVLDAVERSADEQLQQTAAAILSQRTEWADEIAAAWLRGAGGSNDVGLPSISLALAQKVFVHLLDAKSIQDAVAAMLRGGRDERQAALSILAEQTAGVTAETWYPPLEKSLDEASLGDLALVFDAIKKLKTGRFDSRLKAIADDPARPLAIRLKALGSMKGVKLSGATFDMVREVLTDPIASAAARIQAGSMLAAAPLSKEQSLALAPLLAAVGPVELKELLPIVRKIKDEETGQAYAESLAKNPAIGGMQESLYRTAFSNLPPEIFEKTVLPALQQANAASDAKKRTLPALAEKAASAGRAEEGHKVFDSGKGTCIACHQIGGVGRPIGPDLTKIGSIRTERDLLESILFPSNTLARDYEAHVIETSDGQIVTGVIKSHSAEGLVVADAAGQEHNIQHQKIVSNTTLPFSLMPMGLDLTLPEQDLLDLVAYIRSLK